MIDSDNSFPAWEWQYLIIVIALRFFLACSVLNINFGPSRRSSSSLELSPPASPVHSIKNNQLFSAVVLPVLVPCTWLCTCLCVRTCRASHTCVLDSVCECGCGSVSCVGGRGGGGEGRGESIRRQTWNINMFDSFQGLHTLMLFSSRIGAAYYSLLSANCEHFATSIRYGAETSVQWPTPTSFFYVAWYGLL